LVRVAGRPFVAWQLERLASCGFDEVVFCVAHLSTPIQDFVGSGSTYGLRVSYSDDGPHLLGTGGALRRALPLLRSSFVVTYGDSYLPFDYAAPLADLDAHPQALGTLAVYPNHNRWEASNTQVEGQWVRRYAKGLRDPALDHIDYGAMALRVAVLERYPAAQRFGLDQVQRETAAAGRLRALVAAERFYEVGSVAGIAELERYLGQGAASPR
jgi:NDP-sugar pyrophosphorylase family protein